jgi:hypothetical protein
MPAGTRAHPDQKTLNVEKALMKTVTRILAIALLSAVNLPTPYILAQDGSSRSSQRVQAAAANPVAGSGTVGQIVKWTGLTGETFTVGNSIITETKTGLIGIGTQTPASRLSVLGTIESLSGGFKFPDGTLQTTAGLGSVFRDATLIGNGTAASPLGIAPFGVGNLQLGNAAVTSQKIANGSVVRSLNGLFDDIRLEAGSNISITPSGNTLSFSVRGVLSAVAHDGTLTGDGSGSAPLGIARGGVDTEQLADLAVGESKIGGGAVTAAKIKTPASPTAGQFLSFNGVELAWQTPAGGVSVPLVLEGVSPTILSVANIGGGIGVAASGGGSTSADAADALQGQGGSSLAGNGGFGLFALGGFGSGVGNSGGAGVFALSGLGFDGARNGLAGSFLGDVEITGSFNVTSGTKNFKIDHPLDPENKYLYHAAIESSEVLNIYSGNVTADANGEAVVSLPDWFEAINKDFRYQLTVIGSFAQAIVGSKIKNNRFTIRTSAPNVEVSWQVVGVRSDAAMLKRPFKVEEEKADGERGLYLDPAAFNQPEEKQIQLARRPELIKQLRERRQTGNQR